MCQMTYLEELTLHTWPSRSNIIHNKCEKSQTDPFGAIAHTPIVMHVIAVIIIT